MNLDQDDVLTAYLDDELEPEPRRRVDSALASDLALSETLHDLAAVRDMVLELVETADAVDVSGVVLGAIRRHREARSRAASWAKRGAALVSAAAALVALASVGFVPVGRGVAPRRWVMNALAAHPRPNPVRVVEVKPDAPIRVAAASIRTAPAVDGLRERERKEVRALLKSPTLRKVLIVTDVIGGNAERQVGDLIKKTPRRSAPYRQFVVSQGIAFDPDHPGEAMVFAIVMDDRELDEFRASLDKTFPAAVMETEPRPELVTAMGEVGKVSVFPGTPVAEFTAPAEGPGSALKAGPGDLAQADVPATDFEPLVSPLASRKRPARRKAPASSLVLVMVTSPKPNGSKR